ncbi:hypothetical protein KR018_004029 [Drosophila ironensis]|nr:hypothetical protein KR018_004029 [Drosophila ironensis]
MECVLDEELLANIKSSDADSDPEAEQEPKMQAEEQMPPLDRSTEDVNMNGEDSDPLQESGGTFRWLFEESDVLMTDDQLEKQASVRPAKRGRGRPSSGNYTSPRGQVWSTSRDTQAGAEELPILGQKAAGKGPALTVSNAVEAWMLLFDDEMLKALLGHVNEEIRKRRTPQNSQRLVDVVELRAFLGLCYLCGVFRNSEFSGPLDELWTLELGNAVFRASMTLTRFEGIVECLAGSGGMAEGQKIWRRLLINSRSYYGCSSWLTVDETACPVANARLSLCCDARTLYLANAVISREQKAPARDVEQLICDFKSTGRNVTLGGRLLSPAQCTQMEQRQLSSLGMLQVSSPDWPRLWPKEKPVYSGPCKLIPNDMDALFSCGLSGQVDALQAFHSTSQACQQFHDLCQRYSTAHARPPSLAGKNNPLLQLLCLVLNAAALNAWILLRLSPKGDPNIEQRDFQRQLGLFLTQQRLQRRLQRRSTNTALVMRLQICEILGQPSERLLSEAAGQARESSCVGVLDPEKMHLPAGVKLASRHGDKHRRCKPCARDKRATKSRTRCQQCLSHRCGKHLIYRCFECVGILPEKSATDEP